VPAPRDSYWSVLLGLEKRVALEVEAVGVGFAESELGDPPGFAPADLSSDLAEPLPAQPEPRKSPLQEVDALGVGHAP
jgi:hypothetical protein